MSTVWKLPALRTSTYPTPATLSARRNLGGSGQPVASAPGVAVRETEIAAVPCFVCEPPGARGIALYFHGGGYRLGIGQALGTVRDPAGHRHADDRGGGGISAGARGALPGWATGCCHGI